MTTQRNQSRRQRIPKTPSDQNKLLTEPSVPAITKETWELLEYRIWNSFKTKLWAVVGIVLTTLSFMAYLGMNTWVKYVTDQALKAETLRFEEERKKFEKLVLTELNGWTVVLNMEERLRRELERHHALANSVITRFPDQISDLRATADFSNLLLPNPKLPSDSKSFFKFVDASATESRKKSTSNGPPSKVDVNDIRRSFDFRSSLSDLHASAAQITSIRSAIIVTQKKTWENSQADLVSVDNIYRTVFYAEYVRSMHDIGGPTSYFSVYENTVHLLASKISKELPWLSDSPGNAPVPMRALED